MSRIHRLEALLRAEVHAVDSGRLPRRAFVQRMAALGIGAELVNAMLADPAAAQPAATATGRPARRGGGGLLKMLFWQGPTLLNWHLGNGAKDVNAARLFYEPLASFDGDARLVPVLASELPTRANGGIAADGRSTTWRLKPGVSWHDGRPLSAQDVVFTWQFATDPQTAAVTVGEYAGIQRVEALDARTVRFVFDRPSPVPYRAAHVHVLPRHHFEAYKGTRAREAPANVRPVGTGPFRCVDFKPGDLVKGELFTGYHLPLRPHFDAVEIKGGGDPLSAARAVLQTGEYDFALNLQVEDELLRRLESGGRGRLDFAYGGDTEFIQLHAADPWTEVEGERAHPKSRHPVLSDPAVRRALRLLVDRKVIQDVVYGRTGMATPYILNNPTAFNSRKPMPEPSVDEANRLLDAAGWKRGSDGRRSKDGHKLQFVFQTSVNAARQKVQAICKQAFAKAGIEVEIKAINAAVFFSGDPGNPETLGKFWADLQMFSFTRTPDPSRYMQLFVSWEAASKANQWHGLNQTRWASAEYDEAFKASELELDPVRRAALFIRMNDLVVEGGHVIPLVVRPKVTAFRQDLVGTVSGWGSELGFVHDWYRQA